MLWRLRVKQGIFVFPHILSIALCLVRVFCYRQVELQRARGADLRERKRTERMRRNHAPSPDLTRRARERTVSW